MELTRFIIARLAVASVSLCIVISFAHALNVFKRAEWLVYTLDTHAFFLGYVALAHILSIPLYIWAKSHRLSIENTLNILTVLASAYFMVGLYVFNNS